MAKVLVTKDKLDSLANSVAAKSGVPITMTIDEMKQAVDSIVIPSGTIKITSQGNFDVTEYANANIDIDTDVKLQSKTVTPIESKQTITADTGYYGLSTVTVSAISSLYVGSAIPRKTDSDLTVNGAKVFVPDGYYANTAQKTIPSGTAGTPTATKGTVSNHSISITPSVTNTTGYIVGGTKNGTSVTVSASELVSGSIVISQNNTGIDVTNYASVDVDVQPSLQAKTGISPSTSSQTIIADSGYYGLSSVQINAMPVMTLPTEASSTSSGTAKATINRSTSVQYINIPTGYNGTSQYYTISATPNGVVTAPSEISGTTATVTTGNNSLTLTKTVSVTPNVSTIGYISSGTAGNSTVSLTANIPTLATTTYNTSTSNQTISSGRYITGTQTIRAVTTSNITAANIAKGVTVKVGDSADDDRILNVTGTYTSDATAAAKDIVSGQTAYVNGAKVTGTLSLATYYTGSSTPSSSLGNNGDIYFKTS